MATLGHIASLLHEMYDGGRIKVTNLTFEERDMLEYVKLGYANVMRNMWLTLNKGNTTDEYYFFTGLLTPREFDVNGSGRVREVDMSGVSLIRMPQNNHLFEVLPVGSECAEGGNAIPMVQPAEAKFYRSGEYADLTFFEPRGNKLYIYNLGDCIKQVEVTSLYDDEKADIPADIAFDVIKSVLKDVFGIKEIDRVKIDDNSNAMMRQIKSQIGIAAAQ
jgi:hypothetical protein